VAGLRPVFLMGRGFPSVEVLRVLREERARYCTPVRRTDNVVNVTAGHAAGISGRVSTVTMESKRSCERYTAVIVPRRDSGVRPGAPAPRRPGE